jgi:hypothetical protein
MSFTFSAVAGLVKGIFKPACDLIDELHVSDEERGKINIRLGELQNEASIKLYEFIIDAMKIQKEVIVTEMQGNWLQRSWRPILMLMIMAIIFNNYLFMPYVTALTGWNLMLELPYQMWNLLTAGVGGYVVGRSGEKIAKALKAK